MAKAPLGVIILAVLNILVGVLILVGSLNILGPWNELILNPQILSFPNASLIIGLLYVVLGIGLISLMTWAWWLDMIFAILNLILSVIGFPSISWLTLIMNLIIVLYLNQGSIRRRFKV